MAEKERIKKRIYFDYSLLFAILFIIIFGAVMIYSASSYMANIKFHQPMYFITRQLLFAALGLIAMAIVAFIDYHWYVKFSPVIYSGALILSVLVFFIGREFNGKKRWLAVGGLTFQPAEIVKIGLILILAYLFTRNKKILANKNMEKLGLFSVIAIPSALVAINNLSSGIIIFMIGFLMVFVVTKHKLLYGFAAALGVVGYYFAHYINYIPDKIFPQYRKMRILVWLEPEKYPMDGGFQVLQGLYAVGSGGIGGKGLGQSLQKFRLPEAHNDMIFAIICEELGFVGAVLLILVFAFILFRLVDIASSAKDLEGSLIVVGVIIHIATQLVLNIAVVTNAIPNTGIGLPFISYGGTSLIFLMAEMGMVFSVAKGIRQEY